MPVSKAPRKPPSGKKFLLISHEARELRAAIGIVVYQNQQLTALLHHLAGRVAALEPKVAPGDTYATGEVVTP